MKYIRLIFIFSIAFLILAANYQTRAATFTVTNTNDSGAGSLRQAILDANVNDEEDTIVFDQNLFNIAQTITLTSGQLVIERDAPVNNTKKLTIVGPGAHLLTIDGNNQSRVLLLEEQASAVISGIKVTGGNGIGSSSTYNGNGGGGIKLAGASKFLLMNSIVSGNRNTGNFGGGLAVYGGFPQGSYLILNTTISGNVSPGFGGGIFLLGTLEMINTTVSGNIVESGASAIHISNGSLYTTNCTIAFNRMASTTPPAAFGTGIYVNSSNPFHSNFYPRNTIVTNNITNSEGIPADIFGTAIISRGNNIFGEVFDLSIEGDKTGNQLHVDPQLDPVLRLKGGTTPVHTVGLFSPAVDTGNNCVLQTTANGGCLDLNITTDQRGVVRPQDGDRNGVATVDIGAYEVSEEDFATALQIAPDLQSESDSGISNTDNITSASTLVFNISGITAGDTIELLRNGVVVASSVADGSTIILSDSEVAESGLFSYAVRRRDGSEVSIPSPALAVTRDRTSPTISINQAVGQLDPTHNQPINFSIDFSEPIFGFDASKVSLTDSTAGVSSANITVNGSGTTYDITISNITADGVVRVNILPGAVQDAAGNPNVVSAGRDNAVTYDTTRPSVTVNRAANQSDPTRNQPINFTVVFSEIVNGFSKISISLAGSTANVSNAVITITGSGTTYNVAVSNVTSNGGFVRLSLFESAGIDLASNPSFASTGTDNQITIDNIAPTVTINRAAGQSNPTNQLPVNFTVVFSEPVTGFDASDISFNFSSINTAGASIVITGSGATYNVAVGNITSNGGVLRASVKSGAASDLLGNLSFISASTDNTVIIDNVSPSVSINQAIGQNDPASTQPINFTVVFNELVSGFDASDISLSGSTANVSAAVITVTGNGNVYNIQISNIRSNGQVRATIAAEAARDAAGNLSSPSTSSDNIIKINVKNALFDFDGDGKSDVSVFRPNGGNWYILQSASDFTGAQFGISTDKIVPADYDGDGKTDLAVYRSGTWYINRSQLGFTGFAFGAPDDIPQPADFDGDGRADLAVFRPSNGYWYVYNLATDSYTATQFGSDGDKPVAADYNGDGKADYAVFRPSAVTWFIARPTGVPAQNFDSIPFGDINDKAVPADYDGDGKTDIAVYRPSNGVWYLLQSAAEFTGIQFGISTDLPVPADYDGDGKTDLAVFRNGIWYLRQTTNGFTGIQFGADTDKPIPNVFVP